MDFKLSFLLFLTLSTALGSTFLEEEEEEQSEAEKVVEAIKARFGGENESPTPVQKVKLVFTTSDKLPMTPAQPVTSLLNGVKRPEVPEDESDEIPEGEGLYLAAIGLLGTSLSRESTGYHVITSVGKTEKVEQAYVLLQEAAGLGYKKAMELVAWGQLLGPLEIDIPSAKAKFEALAKLGFPNAQMALGFLHASGMSAELSNSLPIVYYSFGSMSGSSWAQMALGYRYWAGIGVQASCEKALEQYRRVAATVASEVSEVGTGPAIQRIRLLDEVEGVTSTTTNNGNILNSDILDYYTMLAERGDLQAQVGLGQLHFQGGRGISPDHHLALRYFQRAADAGSAVAMAFLGKMYLEGNDAVESDPQMALKWFKKAAEQGSPVGQSGLGIMYLNGKGLKKDTSKALQYFTLAAEQGWVDGQLQLGNMYMAGLGVRRDYQQASKYYNLAAQSGHILAIYNLAQMHATGTGMMRSCTASVELYKSVAERGRWGLLLSDAHQDYKEKNFEEASVKYLLLAELGYEVAQANAAFMMERGEVGQNVFQAMKLDQIDKDAAARQLLSRSLQHWSRSASQGYSSARVRLGDFYYYGWGTIPDYTSAAAQYRLAYEQQRSPQAMFNLAYMHEQGLGLKQDLHLAKRFYDMAAETSPDAKVPVALALIKLSLVSCISGIQETNVDFDVIVLTILIGILVALVIVRGRRN